MTHNRETEGLRPSEAYDKGVANAWWQDDAAQREVLKELDRVYLALLDRHDDSLLESMWKKLRGDNPTPRGLYLWGGVGRGKTFLMDLLFDSLPGLPRFREHFHRFMGRIHAGLKARAGMREPLEDVAEEWAKQTRLICLDEFIVQDIGDAMLLGNLLKALFERGVVLITTSNTAPPNLYKDGLQRARFLPAIELIQQQCVVQELLSVTDYRLRALQQAKVYLDARESSSEAEMHRVFAQLSPGSEIPGSTIELFERAIAIKRQAEGIMWFEFTNLCEGPRAAADYIELAKSCNTLLLSNVPVFDGRNEDAAKRFVHLIDELYDRRVNLVLSAFAPPLELYRGHKHDAEFERTASRLIEMQSEHYLGAEHGA